VQRFQIVDQVGELFRAEVADDAEGNGDFLLDAAFDPVLVPFMRQSSNLTEVGWI